MDPILFILGVIGFVIVSAISNLAEKKKQREREEEARRTGAPPPPAAQGPQPSIHDWQEQLRRMLNQEAGPHAPPPIIQPPPVKRATQPEPPPEPPRRPAPSMAPKADLYEKAARLQQEVAGRVRGLEEKKMEIQKGVAADLPTTPGLVVRRKPVMQARRPVHPAVRLLRNRQTLRHVFVGSVILGPPRAFEE